jgi:hypothetical protein
MLTRNDLSKMCAELTIENDRLRKENSDLENRLSMACESPPDDCECPGCSLAAHTAGECEDECPWCEDGG